MKERHIIEEEIIAGVNDLDLDTLTSIVRAVRQTHMKKLSYGELLEYAKECGVDAE
jgi:hypothetical protein